MGFDWENILGASGPGLDDAYDATVSAVLYPDQSGGETVRSFPVGDEHDETRASKVRIASTPREAPA